MKAALARCVVLAGIALLGAAASLPVAAQVEGKPTKKVHYEAAVARMQAGVAQSCRGDLSRLRYPFEDGYRRALNAAKRSAESDPADASRQALLLAVTKLPVRQVRPDGARASSPDETAAATARGVARANLKYAIAVFEKLEPFEPEGAVLQRDLAVAYSLLARVSGHREGSRDLYQKAVDVQKSVVAKDADNKVWQRDLADMYEGLGSVQFGMGGETQARTAKMAEIEIREKLAEAEPANTKLQHELALNYDRLGAMFNVIGNQSQASSAFLAGFEIYEKLVKLDPANSVWQGDLARNRRGAADLEKAKLEAEWREQALRLRIAIVERDPSNTDAQMELLSSYLEMGKDDGEGNVYRSALAHMQRMAAAHPADPAWLYYQLELLYQIGFHIEDEIRPRLGTTAPSPKDTVERVTAETDKIFQSMLGVTRTLTSISANPETVRIYETAQAPRPCTISL